MRGKYGKNTRMSFERTQKTRHARTTFFYFRAVVCIVIIALAVILKWSDAPVVSKVSKAVNEGLGLDEAVEAISRAANGDYGIAEVFGKKKTEKEDEATASDKNTEAVFGNDFYIEKDTRALEEELEREKEKKAAEAARVSVENLSFQMTAEELYDDTEAVPFRIPPPSNCSYKKEEIKFKYGSPLNGVITSKYGYRDHPIMEDASFHTGLDIAAKKGSKISAFASGTVLEKGKNSIYGNYLIIDHGGGFTSFYGHNSKVTVKKGEKVKLGQKVAEVGSTGMSTGAHLHFEIRKNNIRLDPALYISPATV